MINYEYLSYLQGIIESMKLLENLMKDNINTYLKTQDIKYIEYLLNNIDEILKLIPLQKEYYYKAFNI